MPEVTGRQTPGSRLVLGFDSGCSACSGLARRIEKQLAGKLEVLSLRETRVEEWRKKTLGEDAPLVPTLFEVRESGVVRAWTGWRMGANLGRFLGPADTWRVMQALDEFGGASEGASEDARPERHRPAGRSRAVGGLTRGQFLKGVGRRGGDVRAIDHRQARLPGRGPGEHDIWVLEECGRRGGGCFDLPSR